MKKFRRRSARANLEHFRVLTARYFRQIFTNAGILLPLLLQAPVMVLILFIVADTTAFTSQNLLRANIILFMLVVMSALMGLLNSYREICKERDILAREVFGGLDVSSYVLSKTAVLSAVGAVQSALLFAGSLLFIDYNMPSPAVSYPRCFLTMILTNISVTALGLFISALLKKSESAILPVLIVIILQVVFSDCLISLDGAAGFIKYITPAAWGIAVFGNIFDLDTWPFQATQHDLYGLHPVVCLAVLAAFALLFLFLTTAKLKREFRQKD